MPSTRSATLSLTLTGWGIRNTWFGLKLLAGKLRALGCSVLGRNFGKDGSKTGVMSPGMLYRLPEWSGVSPAGLGDLAGYGSPDIGIILAGTNDLRGISVLSSTGTTATATSTGHAYVTGDTITVFGASPAGYNVVAAPLTYVDANTFSYPVVSGLSTPATGASIYAQLQTQTNLSAMVKALKFGGRGVVAGQASLPTYGNPGDRYVVLNDTSTTGGLAAGAGMSPTIPGSWTTSPTVWENRNGGANGWGRIATDATVPDHCSKVIIANYHYLNWSANGDALALRYWEWSDVAGSNGIGIAQKAVAASEGVVYADVYTYYRNLIVSGQETQGSYSWHVADQNVHLNALGNSYMAEALLAVIQAQPGWMASLT